MSNGVLLVNLGSPASPAVPDVRRYLREFLMDERVLDLPFWGRFLLVYGLILPFRPKKSAEAYHKIWTPQGSPLIVTGRKVQQALQQRTGLQVELGMRYQQPSIAGGLLNLKNQGVTNVLVIPLFPHFAMSSYETAVERAKTVAARITPGLKLQFLPPYYQQPDYLQALADSAAPYLKNSYDHLLFSFHGLPERHLVKADPTGQHCLKTAACCQTSSPAHKTCYRAQCFKTVEGFVQRTGVTKYSTAFQSRLGRAAWIKPYTDEELARLAMNGVKKLLVICPAFVADCLETLEEIGIRGRQTFRAAGGQDLQLIPCLNDHPTWLATLAKWATLAQSDGERAG
jgi:protoporphyrin/coproporphyrin ferrochelatase